MTGSSSRKSRRQPPPVSLESTRQPDISDLPDEPSPLHSSDFESDEPAREAWRKQRRKERPDRGTRRRKKRPPDSGNDETGEEPDANLDGDLDDRRTAKRQSRKAAAGSWKRIWSINGFLDPWVTGVLGKTFGWWVFRRFMKETPWMIMLVQVIMMAYIGTTCLEPIDGLLGPRFHASIGDANLGGWGYCTSG